jgi:hypothetical protein
MAKGAIILLIAFLVLIGGAKYYETYYSAFNHNTNSTKPKPPPPFWGGDTGTNTPIITPPPSDSNMTFGLYWNDTTLDDDTRIASINWGVLSPGENKSVSFYLRNEGSVNITVVNASISNWFFQNYKNETLPTENSTLTMENYTSFFTLTLDYGNMTVVPNEVRTITLFLAISDLIQEITRFSFDITIHGF